VLDAFRPNKNLSAKAWTILLVIEVAILGVAWSLGDSLSIPGPLDTVQALGRLITQEGLLFELWVSFKVNIQAIAISSVLSIGLSYLTVLPVMRPFVEFCSKARFFSIAGFVTMFTLAFGGGHALKVALLTFGMTVFFVTSMSAVVAGIDKSEWDQARSLRMPPWRMVWEVVVLGKADEAFEVLRQNAVMGWMMLTLVEGLVRSEGGIGGILLNQSKYRHWDAVFAIQLTVLLVGTFQDMFIVYLKRVFCPYAFLTLERK
jgi:NitT/TauT family transport system permease protein